MGLGHASAALGIIALVFSVALLMWIEGKDGVCCCKKVGKFFAWLSIILSLLLIAGQIFMCASVSRGDMCKHMMGGPGMMMQHNMGRGPMIMPPPANVPSEQGKSGESK